MRRALETVAPHEVPGGVYGRAQESGGGLPGCGSAVARVQEFLEEGGALCGDRLGVVPHALRQGFPAHELAPFRVVDQFQERFGQGVDVAGRHQQAVHPVGDDLARAVRAVGAHHGQAYPHGLDDGHAEGLHP